MLRPGLRSVLLGAATFLAAHAIEVAARIGGDHPWFIAALPSALFTTALIFAAGVIVGTMSAGRFADAYLLALFLVVGAAVPMTITLFTHPRGPGNLFPFALAFGTGVLLISSVAGIAAGWILRRMID